MTDSEIMKGLQWCAVGRSCESCPISKKCDGAEHLKNALSLINRQKAEIERLKDSYMALNSTIEQAILKAKSEAVKEFAERLKVYASFNEEWGEAAVLCHEIDNLVKEMVGEG